MSIIARDRHRTSNVLKRELWGDLGYCRTAIKKVPGVNYRIGELVTAEANMNVPTKEELLGVVVDFQHDDWLVVLYRGPAAIRFAGLSDNTDLTDDEVKEALEAKNILCLDGE